MIDVDLIKLLPKSFEDLQKNFKLSSILPGGSHCMMNAVSSQFNLHVSRNKHCRALERKGSPLAIDCLTEILQVNINGRPFMGPNLYITPPSSFTHFHQDGHVS